MNVKNLQKTYQALYEAKIPSFCGQDSLDDWLEELIELDAYLVGLACSAISGVKILKKEIPEVSLLKNSLHQMLKLYPIHESFINQFNIYLDLLIQVENALRDILK